MSSSRERAVVDPARAAETTTGASVARSSAWNLAATVIPQAYLVVVSIAAARFLGPDNFGRQSFIAFVEISLVTLLIAGLATALSRFVGASLGAREPGHVRILEHVAARVSWVAAAIAAATLVVVAFVGAGPRGAWLFAAVYAAASILQSERNALLTGFQRWRQVTIGGLVVGALAAAFIVGVLALGGGITGIFAVEAGASVAFLVWTAVLARELCVPSPPGGRKALRRGGCCAIRESPRSVSSSQSWCGGAPSSSSSTTTRPTPRSAFTRSRLPQRPRR